MPLAEKTQFGECREAIIFHGTKNYNEGERAQTKRHVTASYVLEGAVR